MTNKYFIVFLFICGIFFITLGSGILQNESIKSEVNYTLTAFNPKRNEIQEVYFLINKHRKEKGLHVLNVNSLLEKSSQAKIDDMVKNDYWSHNDKEGISPWHFFNESGYAYSFAGENLAREDFAPDEIVKLWKESREHNENLIHPKAYDMGYSRTCGINLTLTYDTCVMVLHVGSK